VWAKGEYDISASVEEAVVGETVVEVAEGLDKDGMPMDVLGGAATRGRRCWVCREVCLIIARDLE
jgi:hypothetical protein